MLDVDLVLKSYMGDRVPSAPVTDLALEELRNVRSCSTEILLGRETYTFFGVGDNDRLAMSRRTPIYN